MVAFGLSFGTPALLGGLSLVAAPLIIHLLFRRRYREVNWAAMRWLLAAMKKNHRRVRIEQWLLLALRTLLVALVILAMARPTLDGTRSLLAAPARSTHHILVIDGSMSMHYRQSGETRWERAKRMAQGILDDADPGDVASVIVMANPNVVLVGDPSPYLDNVAKEIDGLRPGHTTGKIAPTLDLIADLLKNSPASRQQVVFLTDLQQSGWLSESLTEPDQQLADKLDRIGKSADVTFLDVAGSEGRNHAVTSIDLVDPLAVVGKPTVLRARLKNFSMLPESAVRVELLVNDQVEATETVDLPASEETTVNFTTTFRTPGELVVQVKLPDDALSVDDHRQRIVLARESVACLVIDGKPAGRPFESETDYLRVALAPDERKSTGSFVRVDTKTEAELADVNLFDYDLVVLANVAQLTAQETSLLKRFLASGGGVLFYVGNQVKIDAYNQTIFNTDDGLLPIKLGSAIGTEAKDKDFFSLAPGDYKHPVVAPFRDAERAGLLTAKVFKYLTLEITPEAIEKSLVEVVLRYSNQAPAIIVGPSKLGRAGVVTTSADLSWNNWAISPSFVPIVQELMRYLVVGRISREPVTAGELAVFPVTSDAVEITAMVSTPNFAASGGETVTIAAEEKQGRRELRFANTERAGIYRLALRGLRSETLLLAVNPPTEESTSSKFDQASLKQMFPNARFRVEDDWLSSRSQGFTGDGANGSLVPPMLTIALVLVVVESFLAWRFGHHHE